MGHTSGRGQSQHPSFSISRPYIVLYKNRLTDISRLFYFPKSHMKHIVYDEQKIATFNRLYTL